MQTVFWPPAILAEVSLLPRAGSRRRIAPIAAALLCVLFVLIASPWIDKPGIQTDEALFAGGIYPPFDPQFQIRIFGHDCPLMVMSYVGALKAHVWAPIFAVWPPSPASVRIPAILLSALSIWWLYCLISRTLGARAALAGVALTATDPIYVLYSRWDHGPVVIQHLCLAGSMLAFVRFEQDRRRAWLAAGFFGLGLGLWEKAIFAWLINGLAIAALAVFPSRIRAAMCLRNLTLAAFAFTLGAAPLILYNANNRWATFRGTTVWSTEDFCVKARLLRLTLDGEVLFGSMIREPWDGPLIEPKTIGAKATVATALALGMPRRTLMECLAIATILLLPLVWRTPARTAFCFASICVAVAWSQMAFIRNAGTGAHHTILLWPLPALAIASVLAAASTRTTHGSAILSAVIAITCCSNLAVLSTYYTNLLRNGGAPSWTDAMYPAYKAIHQMQKAGVCVVDWGFLDSLRLSEQGRLPLCEIGQPTDALTQIAEPDIVFLSHTPGSESFPGVTEKLVRFAEANGFHQTCLHLFADSNGRNTVETFRFARSDR